MISMRRRLLLMLALILLVTQLISDFWLWHESREQISLLVDETLTTKVRNQHVEREIAEAVASLLAPSLIMLGITLLLSFWAISWIIRPLNQLQQRLQNRSADNLTPLPINSDMQEIVSVTTSLNQLLARLSNTIQQERLFTADAAHELRTPLAGIRLHLELMEQKGIAESRVLITRLDLLMHTIEQLLMLSRAGQNFAGGHYQQVDWVEEVALPLREELEEMAAQRHQTLLWQMPPQAMMQGDAVLLRLMLRNLVENAHRYSPAQSRIVITCLARPAQWQLTVSDEGPGIDENLAGELTKAFTRMDQRYGGSGLGLNIVIRIAQLHQATLTLQNRPEGGLSAQCLIPARLNLA